MNETPRSYTDCRRIMRQHRGTNKQRRLIRRDIWLVKTQVSVDEVFIVEYLGTDILHFRQGGSVLVNTSGWRTVQTSKRINTFIPLGFRVFQKKFIWYLQRRGKVFFFEDWMKIESDGEVYSPTGGVAVLAKGVVYEIDHYDYRGDNRG